MKEEKMYIQKKSFPVEFHLALYTSCSQSSDTCNSIRGCNIKFELYLHEFNVSVAVIYMIRLRGSNGCCVLTINSLID
jgi:hypothetical protein